LRRQQEGDRRTRASQLGGDHAGNCAALIGRDGDGGDQPIVCMIGPAGETIRRLLPGGHIHHIDRAGRDNLRNAGAACIFHTVRPGDGDRTVLRIGHFLDAKIEDGGKAPLRRDRLIGTPAHACGMEDGNVVAAPLQLRLQHLHIAEAGGAERGHADQRALAAGPLASLGSADDRAGRLRQHRPADRIETVEPAGPQDHHQVGRDALRRQEMGIGDGGDDELRHAERQHGCDIERKVGAERATKRDHAVHRSCIREPAHQRRRAPGHQRHSGVLVAAAGDRLHCGAGGGGDVMLGMARHIGRVAEHADIDQNGNATGLADDLGHKQQFLALGVSGADHQNMGQTGAGAHRPFLLD
jgi:hypothetical protein